MRTLRTRQRLIRFVLVVAILAAALAPALGSAVHDAVLTFIGLVVPTIAVVVLRRVATRSDNRPVALLSIDFFRAPPSLLSVA